MAYVNRTKVYLVIQGNVATFWSPAEWVKDRVQYYVEDYYKVAFSEWANHKYGVTEVTGEEREEQIEAWEAPGFYYVIIAKNDEPVERIHIYRARSRDAFYPVQPKVEGGFRRVIAFLVSFIDLIGEVFRP